MDIINSFKQKCLLNDCEAREGLGLNPAEYDFFNITHKIKVLEPSHIASLMDLSLSRLSRVIDNLVKGGYIKRTISEKDRRAINLSFTKKGKEMQTKVNSYKKACEEKIASALSPEEFSSLKDNLLTLSNLL